MASERSGGRGVARTRAGRGEARRWRWRAAVGALAVSAAAAAHGQGTGPSPFASVAAPSGVLVDGAGGVLAVSGTPAGASLVRFGADGTRGDEVPLEALGASGEGRLVRIETATVQAIALLTPTGSLVVFTPEADPVEFGLGTLPGATSAPDLEGGNATVDLDTRGARFDDVAAIPSDAAGGTGEPRPVLDFFVTGVTAAAADLGGANQPFLIRARVRLGATVEESSVAVQGLATTTKATVTDPAHRSGVGVYWNRAGPTPPSTGTGVVIATLPVSTSTPEAGDAVVSVGTMWPELSTAQPPAAVTDQGGGVFARSGGMTQDDAGNLYLLVAGEACAPGGGPGVVAISATEARCTELPAATATTGGYVDVAVRAPGDPAYVTDRPGNAILSVPTGLPAVPGPPAAGPPTSARATAGTRLGAAIGRLGAAR